MTYRSTQRLKWQSWSLLGSVVGPLDACCACLAQGVCRSPKCGSGCVFDSLPALETLSPSTGLACPAFIWGFVPSFLVSCCALFSWLSLWGLLFFLKGNGSGGKGSLWEDWEEQGGGRLWSGCFLCKKNKSETKENIYLIKLHNRLLW